ncbi:two-component system chemotaxis sensor kinase CheA [Sphingomonas vulcanisoli]|uniref:histidine kinase n=1 Tax=Sphingomonas vulcanisoli TaxID=1658060 RepID=A0ABX0TTP4_9SPHN|nr:chemotaxis protein CheA [Sphingomonas vulcanisoli]NIJ08887.1 two-component system chemotaxis sensor kinase CheA [Sphingomonas vulcanisoli]
MEELLADFIAETRDTLEAIAGEIVAWEAEPGDRKRLDAIFRFVHTVKGSCGFLDLPRLRHLSHAAEDSLADVRDGERTPDAALVSAVLAIVDRIGELVDQLDATGVLPEGDDETLIEALAPGQVIASASGQPAGGSAAAARAPARTIRLPVELLDRMMSGVSDVVLARNELARALRATGADTGLEMAFERLSLCVADIRDAITQTRMARIDGLFGALPRMVRDLAAELGRSVTLDTDGGDVELDREMIEMIRDPITHIIRNALDHGIEPPEQRVAAGKPRTGRLRIAARQAGNQILIDAIDDGRGIDAEKLVQKAIKVDLITAEAAAQMNWAAKLELIFSPGLSTAQSVTTVSGRGVGMDVVRANIERIGGSVEIESRPGQGLRVTLRVPLTLTIIPALVVGCGDHCFAVPRSAIDEIVRPNGQTITLSTLGDGDVAMIRGKMLPVVDLGGFLDCRSNDPDLRPVLVIVRAGGGERFALKVDCVLDHEELVVKPAAPAIMATGIYAGATLPDDSRPMLLLDVAGLAAANGVRAGMPEPVEEDNTRERRERVSVLLFRDLDGAERGVRLNLVERIEDVDRAQISRSGGRLVLAHNDALIPVAACADIPDVARMRMLQLGDGTARLAYAIEGVIDVIENSERLQPATQPGLVAGVVLIDGRPVEMLDPHWLFSGVALASPRNTPLCLLAGEDDHWSRELLSPLLVAAGYRVTYDSGEERVDVVIATAADAVPQGIAAPVVRLRAAAIADAIDEESVWRYDRDGLLKALGRAMRGA